EGRLVLADAYCWACEQENPAFIVELSTLTGGVVTALGSTYAGLFCDNDALRARIDRASEASGERVWRLPMHQEYRDMMKSPVADILNSNPNRKAHPIQGAAFLSYFVSDGSRNGGFTCIHCRAAIPGAAWGTKHRNHCPRCLWSRHLDEQPGDRRAVCRAPMEPVAIEVRRDGEWAVIHRCTGCGELRV